MKFHEDGTRPLDDKTIFVFGSNLAGRHGAGAAKIALKYYGARYYTGMGRAGRSYAIPTKNERLITLTRRFIEQQVGTFLAHARACPRDEFFVTRIGCGLAGYRDRDIAPMFRDAPSNCSFAEEWRPYLGQEQRCPKCSGAVEETDSDNPLTKDDRTTYRCTACGLGFYIFKPRQYANAAAS